MMFLPLGSSSAWHTRSSQTQQSSDIHYHRLFKINAMKTRYGSVVVSEGAEKERNQPMVAAWFAVKGRSHFFPTRRRGTPSKPSWFCQLRKKLVRRITYYCAVCHVTLFISFSECLNWIQWVKPTMIQYFLNLSWASAFFVNPDSIVY